jgi:ribonucleotide reductase beta subunit family protein with ferritin-like domain
MSSMASVSRSKNLDTSQMSSTTKSPTLKAAATPKRKSSITTQEIPPLELDPTNLEQVPEGSQLPLHKIHEQDEPLLKDNPNRHVIFPIEHPDLWAKYKQHMSVFWIPEEIDLSKDLVDWVKLTDNERHFIKHILGFFAGSDGIVMENLSTRFTNDVGAAEAKFFYACQNLMESVHSESYALLIDTYITDKEDKVNTLRSIQTIPTIQKKAEWALQWISNKEASFATRLLAFAVVEGIFFSGAFCSIFWLKKRGLMPGLCQSNLLISRDEGLHTEFACLLYSKLQHKLTKQEAHKIIREAVKIEKHFITKALPCELIGMNAKLMGDYIEFVADRLAVQLGYAKIYYSQNPFDWMELISLNTKTNFFEARNPEYSKANTTTRAEDKKFAMDADF